MNSSKSNFQTLAQVLYQSKYFDFLVFLFLSFLLVTQFLTWQIQSVFSIAYGGSLALAVFSFYCSRKVYFSSIYTLWLFVGLGVIFWISLLIHQDFSKEAIHDSFKRMLWIYSALIFCFIKRLPKLYECLLIGFFLLEILLLTLFKIVPFFIYLIQVDPTMFYGNYTGSERYNKDGYLHHGLSILAYMGIIVSFFLYRLNILKSQWFKIGIGFLVLYLIVIIFITGARVGIVALFLISLVYFGLGIKKLSKKQILGIVLAGITLLIFLGIMVSKIDSLKERYEFTKVDLLHIIHNKNSLGIDAGKGSLTTRFVNNAFYFQIFEKAKWKGFTGPSVSKYNTAIEKHFLDFNQDLTILRLKPANQWLRFLIQFGFPLTLLYFVLLFMPLFTERKSDLFLINSFLLGIFIYSNTETAFDISNFFAFLAISFPYFIRLSFFYKSNAQKELP